MNDYRYATGFEALIGYLYLIGNTQRLMELFEMISKMDR
jgi:ribonuclease-3 family protein